MLIPFIVKMFVLGYFPLHPIYALYSIALLLKYNTIYINNKYYLQLLIIYIT